MRTSSAILLACWSIAVSAQAQGFKFSDPQPAADAGADARRQTTIAAQLATPCRDRIRNRKIMVLIGESRNGAVQASQSAFSSHFDAINARLQALDLITQRS